MNGNCSSIFLFLFCFNSRPEYFAILPLSHAGWDGALNLWVCPRIYREALEKKSDRHQRRQACPNLISTNAEKRHQTQTLSSTKMALVTLHGDFGLSSLALVWGLQERRMSQPAENLGLAGLAVSAANVRAVQGLELVSIQQNTSKYYPVVIIYCCILCYIQPYPLIITYNILKPDICSCSFQCSIKMQMRGGSILLPGGAPYVWQHCPACTHC